jgi:hypothetical protein
MDQKELIKDLIWSIIDWDIARINKEDEISTERKEMSKIGFAGNKLSNLVDQMVDNYSKEQEHDINLLNEYIEEYIYDHYDELYEDN